LRGHRAGGQFGSFGATLANPRLGVAGVPTNINLQGLAQMDSSQQQAAAALYNQGLGVDFNDILGRAQKSALATKAATAKRYGR
jgi:hypothetical protein